MLEPVFWQSKEGHVIAMDWCEGFMDALHVVGGTGFEPVTPAM
jgi:hypothetical protein